MARRVPLVHLDLLVQLVPLDAKESLEMRPKSAISSSKQVRPETSVLLVDVDTTDSMVKMDFKVQMAAEERRDIEADPD